MWVNTIYEQLLIEADELEIVTKEKTLKRYDGRIRGNKIAIRKTLSTNIEKACVLAEELGHYHTTIGNIVDQNTEQNRKQEHKARIWAYNKLVGLNGIINAHKNRCCSLQDTADYLGITDIFLKEALKYYQSKYGQCITVDNYIIYFEPAIGVLELIEHNSSSKCIKITPGDYKYENN